MISGVTPFCNMSYEEQVRRINEYIQSKLNRMLIAYNSRRIYYELDNFQLLPSAYFWIVSG